MHEDPAQGLPPLPKTTPLQMGGPGWNGTLELDVGMFTAAQMRSYALAAVEAERERCAKLCEVVAASQADWLNGPALDCAAAIRNQGKG